MENINSVIIDDETSAQKVLWEMLKAHCPQVQVQGIASSLSEGVQLLETTQPDLVFMDIRLSAYDNAFDLIGRTRHLKYGLVLVTAYPQYAIRAINLAQPWAYLVKPYSTDDLMEAVRIAAQKLVEKKKESATTTASLLVTDLRGAQYAIPWDEISYCYSRNALVEIYFVRNNVVQKIYTAQTLKQLQTMLPEKRFCRIHHNSIVHFSAVRHLKKTGRNGQLELKNGETLEVSVKKMKPFETAWQQFHLN